ncbi:MAG TPA: molybdopterin-dependent oxidoreductase [Polyangiaceae bacterium]|nr:molybdopterin-dependent oxidoreductase [Polyangiaceae bacterium]
MPDTPNLSRRGWLGGVAATAAAGATLTSSSEAQAFSLLRSPEAVVADRVVPSYCELCFWNCGLLAEVKGNRILSLRGHPDYPNAQGRLCGRGNAGAASVIDRDRLKYPMVRVGARGEGRFERVGWKTAYRTIAQGFQRIKAEHGAQALALLYHGRGGPLIRRMLVAFGSPNYAAPSYAQCKGSRDVAYKLTFGEKLTSPEPLDLDETRCMVLFGSHLGENAHNSQVQEFVRARRRGASLVVLDPRMSTVASRADVWLPVRPGSDTAVLLAWIHLLLREKAWNAAFVDKHTVGFEKLERHVQPFTPEWAAAQAGVPAADILRAFDLMRKAMPAVLIHPGRHVTWYGEPDIQRGRAQAILTALLGAFWAPGGIFRPSSPTVKEFPGPDFPDLPKSVDEAAGKYPFAPEVTTTGIREATRTGKPYPVKGWFVHGTNLIQSMPNVGETIEAIRNLDMLVVCDVMPTEIVQWADVVLPEDTYLERYDDLQLGAGKKPYIGIRQPVVTSPHDTRPAWRIAKELSQELGVGDQFAFETFEEYLSARLEGSGVTLAELKKKGVHQLEPTQPAYLRPDEDFHWHTPTGKVELFSQQLADKGFSPLPTHTPIPEPPAGAFRLLYGRSPLHSFGRTQNNPILHDLDSTNVVWMHPAAASKLGLEHGVSVMVTNDKGDATGPVSLLVTERIAPECVYMVHGFGHRSKGLSRANGQGASDSDLVRDYALDPIGGTTGMRTQTVRVRAAQRQERR